MVRHLAALDRAVVRTAYKPNGRLLVQMPPRHGKSEYLSKYLPSHYLGTFPDRRVILTSYEAGFAAQWGRKARTLTEEFGNDIFGVKVASNSSAADRWDIEGREGGMQTAGAGGAITGKGADLLIVDDPFKNWEEAMSPTIRDKVWDWWQSTAYTRLEPGGSAIVLQTRWHQDDLIGRLQKAQATGHEYAEQWEIVHFPAINEDGEALWPERYNINRLRQIEYAEGPYKWSCLYQQKPTLATQSEWPESYWSNIWADRWPDRFELASIAIDPSKGKDAKKGDYSAIVFVGLCGGLLYVDADIERRPPSQIVADSITFYRHNPADGVLLESNQFQELLATEFDNQCRSGHVPPLPLHLVENRVNKNVRIGRLDPYFSRGLIRFRNTPGCKLLLSQLREWPLAHHDDGPDAMEMAIRLLDQMSQIPTGANAVNVDEYGNELTEISYATV
jgi:predicted phage terminase large subunit-like protein